jgi:hypothetical protein
MLWKTLRTSTDDGGGETVLQAFTQSVGKSVRQYCYETGVDKTSVNCILLCEKKPCKLDRAQRKCGVCTLISSLSPIRLLHVG